MAKITADILKSIAPSTPSAKLRALIEPLNSLLPHYKIDDELEVAGFLATAAFESDYFRTLHEYGKGKGRKYGAKDKTTGLVYYGRGIFQNTWKTAYVNFTKYVRDNWKWIAPLTSETEPPDFVHNPDLVATEFWAVLGACWYWQQNGLAKWAAQGEEGFFELQGLVNRGSANKRALDYDNRLKIYQHLRKTLPNNFTLTDSTAAPVVIPSEKTEIEIESEPTELQPSDENTGLVQNAEQIINTGDTVPPPETETKSVELPPSTGTGTETKRTVYGTILSLPVIGVLWKFGEKAFSEGTIDFKMLSEVFKDLFGLLMANFKWVVVMASIFIAYMLIRKVIDSIPYWIAMVVNARKDMHNLEIKP